VRLCQDNSDGQDCFADQAFNTKQPGFQEEVALEGLELPTAVRFAADGRVFVAEKSGIVKVFDSLNDPTPATFADLRTRVYNNSDRGLLGLALDPSFPTRPYVYVAYHHDALPGGSAPRYGSPGTDSDPCPDTGQSCPSDGRISRLTAAGNQMTAEKVLVDDYCFQYDSHSVGHLAFGPGGALYASAGDGSSYWFADYGQVDNPCGDPPGPAGADLTAPAAEGGSLRSQDLRTAADPAGLNGAIIRIHPDTGDALADNPLAASPDPNARRIVAYGLRNPYRFAIRPGTGEVWTGGRRLGRVGGDQSDRQPHRHAGREPRLAVLPGRDGGSGIRERRPEPVREPLRGDGRRPQPVLRLPARGPGGRRRELRQR
jgi:glucose/arabinose dehydrogenase